MNNDRIATKNDQLRLRAAERREHPGDGEPSRAGHPAKEPVVGRERAAASVEGAERGFGDWQPAAYDWARAAKAAARATAVLSAWEGPGRDQERDDEAVGALAAFAREARDMDRSSAALACDMLWSAALSQARMAGGAWGGMVDRAVGSLEHPARDRVREALVAAAA